VSAFGSFGEVNCLVVLAMCVSCVLRGLCVPDDVCRFGHCRACGSVCSSSTDCFGFRWLRCSVCGWRSSRVMRRGR